MTYEIKLIYADLFEQKKKNSFDFCAATQSSLPYVISSKHVDSVKVRYDLEFFKKCKTLVHVTHKNFGKLH